MPKRLTRAREELLSSGYDTEKICDAVAESMQSAGRALASQATLSKGDSYGKADRMADKILTGRWTAFPVMLIFLLGLFWLTVEGANLPSAFLSDVLFAFETPLYDFLRVLCLPEAVCNLLAFGVFPGSGLGGIGHAAAHGDLLSVVYTA